MWMRNIPGATTSGPPAWPGSSAPRSTTCSKRSTRLTGMAVGPDAGRGFGMVLRRLKRGWQSVILPVGLLLVWELVATSRFGDSLYTPSLASIAAASWKLIATGELLLHL